MWPSQSNFGLLKETVGDSLKAGDHQIFVSLVQLLVDARCHQDSGKPILIELFPRVRVLFTKIEIPRHLVVKRRLVVMLDQER